MVHMLHECRWLKMVWTLGKPMHAKSKMRNQMWVIAKRQLLLIFSSYLHYSSITKSTSIVTKFLMGLSIEYEITGDISWNWDCTTWATMESKTKGTMWKSIKNLCQKQVSKVTLHFVWDQLSRKQTVERILKWLKGQDNPWVTTSNFEGYKLLTSYKAQYSARWI